MRQSSDLLGFSKSLLLKAQNSGELDSFMFSHPTVQGYITQETSGSSFKLYKGICIAYLLDYARRNKLEKEFRVYAEDLNFASELINLLPKGFISTGALILRKERSQFTK